MVIRSIHLNCMHWIEIETSPRITLAKGFHLFRLGQQLMLFMVFYFFLYFWTGVSYSVSLLLLIN